MAQDWFDQNVAPSSAPAAPAPARRGGGGWVTDPFKVNAEARADRSANRQDDAAARAAEAAARSAMAAQTGAAKTQQEMGDRDFGRGDKLRNDFLGLPAVKEYTSAVSSLMAGLKSQADGAGDNALIYAYAKAMDPGSVVRESEMGMASSTGSIIESTVAGLKKQLGIEGGGQLSPETRANLRREMNSKVAQLAKVYGVARSDFQRTAQQQGVNPEQVVGTSPAAGVADEYKRIMGDKLKDQPAAIPTTQAQEIDPTGANPKLSPEDRDFLSKNARYMTPEGMQKWHADRGLNVENAQEIYDYYAKGGNLDADISSPQGAGSMVGAALATPLGTGAASYLNAASMGLPQLMTGDAPFDALSARNPKAAITGDILGGITGTLGTAAALAKAGVPLARAGLAADLGYGAAFGANTSEGNRALGSGVGLAAGLVGEGAGRYIAAPAVDALVRSKAGQAVGGMFGRSAPRSMSAPETSLAQDLAPNLDVINTNLADAQRLGLPMSLADASPAARSTLGASTRLDPVMAEQIGNQLGERALGRNDRALKGLANLAEPVDMRATKDEIFKAAQEAASPHYERAYANPAISTPELSNLLQRPSTREAMGKAQGVIAEQGGSPQTLGFALDASGSPVLNPVPTNQLSELGAAQTALEEAQNALTRGNASLAGNVDRRGLQGNVDAAMQRLEAAKTGLASAPSADTLATAPAYNWRALDYTKRGLDDVLEEMRDPITRRMPTDYKARATQATRTQYRDALGNLNDDYKQGLDAFSGIARRNDDLNAGFSAADPSTNILDFNRSLTNAGDEGRDYFQRGFVTNLSDTVNRNRDTSNAYDVIAGGADRRGKLTSLFPNAPDFIRQRELEKMMASTGQEVLGGAATSGRNAANERFGSNEIGVAAELGLSAVTGMPPVNAIASTGEKAIRGMFGRRSQAMTAEAARDIAPRLSNQDPSAASDGLTALLEDMRKLKAYDQAIKMGAGAVIAPTFAVGASQF